jgi:putative membrane protein
VSQSALVAETAKVRWVVAALSLAVVLAVATVIALGPHSNAPPVEPSLLARINVGLNAAAGVFLLVGYAFVRVGNIKQHRRCMLTAFGCSSVFLVTYLLHHAQVGSVPFRGTGFYRPLYFSILLPHILLAGGIVPLALLTVYRGWTNKIAAHRRIARYTLPLWLFVSVSGVIVFAMLYYLP